MLDELFLYEVKDDDSLNSIANKYNCKIEEILYLNQSAKFGIFKGKPLLLRRNNIQSERKSINKNDVIILLYKIKEYFNSTSNNIESNYLAAKIKEEAKSIFQDSPYLKLVQKIIIFPSILASKNEKEIMEYEKEFREYINLLSQNTNNHLSKEELKLICDDLKLYYLKYTNKKYIESENIFEEIIKRTNNLIEQNRNKFR